MLVDRID